MTRQTGGKSTQGDDESHSLLGPGGVDRVGRAIASGCTVGAVTARERVGLSAWDGIWMGMETVLTYEGQKIMTQPVFPE